MKAPPYVVFVIKDSENIEASIINLVRGFTDQLHSYLKSKVDELDLNTLMKSMSYSYVDSDNLYFEWRVAFAKNEVEISLYEISGLSQDPIAVSLAKKRYEASSIWIKSLKSICSRNNDESYGVFENPQ